jgi:hypothetical protein
MILQSLAGRALLCLLAGSFFTLGLAPFDLKLLSLASITTFVIALTGQSWRQSLLLGWCYGLGSSVLANLLGVCQHQCLRSRTTGSSAHVNDVFLRWTGALIRHPSRFFLAAKTDPGRIAHRFIRLPLGGFRMASHVATNRLSLAIRGLYGARYCSGGLGASHRCAWRILAYRSHSCGNGGARHRQERIARHRF